MTAIKYTVQFIIIVIYSYNNLNKFRLILIHDKLHITYIIDPKIQDI